MPFFLDPHLEILLRIISFFYKKAVVEIHKGILEERIKK